MRGDDDGALMAVIRAIVADDWPAAARALGAAPGLAAGSLARGATRESPPEFFLDDVRHYVYAGDTPLHVAAAAHRSHLVPLLVAAGGQVDARNRRGAQPLHYAVDGVPGSTTRDPDPQRDTVVELLHAGADPNAADKSGTSPLHRAVRNRCAGAVEALLDGGADACAPNGRGSTPLQLAVRATGRGGSGSPAAKAAQIEIERLLLGHGALPRH